MPLVPHYIKKLNSYKPGKSISEAKRELGVKNFIKVASNENPLGPSPMGIDAIQKSLSNLHRYPDATGYELREKLAKKFNVNIDNVVLGAGSEGIMSTIMRTFLLNDDELISAANSFIGLYMGDGFIGFPTSLNRNGGYFIATTVNALSAGPVSLGSTMTLHGTWTIV